MPKQTSKEMDKSRNKDKAQDDTVEAWISRKIEQLINEGYEPDRAKAIAYAEHRKNQKDDDSGRSSKIYSSDGLSKREYDLNGYAEIRDNPISKVGVFPYYGRDISSELEPDKIYYVYRPEEELSNPETIKSFKLAPWTDEHAMLGDEEEGLTPPEKKGIHGVIGEDVYYEDGYLKANLKILSNKLADLIDKGKKELSIGYRCLYDIVSGTYKGQKYDAIQRNIRGNHLALVDEGRSGSDVAVLDHFKCTLDTKEIKMPDKNMKDEDLSIERLAEMLKALAEKVDMLMSKEEDGEEGAREELSEKAAHEGDKKAKDEESDRIDEEKREESKIEDADSREEEELSQDEEKPDDMYKPKDKKAMDARIQHLTNEIQRLKEHGAKALFQEISRRDELAKKLSNHIGTFDHSNKTFDEVARYGIEKLGLRCQKGQEAAMLQGFLSAAKHSTVVTTAKDTAIVSSCVDAYLNGGK